MEDHDYRTASTAFTDALSPAGSLPGPLPGNMDSQDMDKDDAWSTASSSVYEAARDISCAASLADSELEMQGPIQGMSALQALQNCVAM